MSRDEATRVVVVDDHPLWREALSRDLEAAGFAVVGTAGSAGQALRVVEATHPDVVVLDLQLPDGSGVDVIRSLVGSAAAREAPVQPRQPRQPRQPVQPRRPKREALAQDGRGGAAVPVFAGAILVVSASGEQADVLDAVKAGASGYLVKSARPEELVDAVRRTAEGAPVFGAGLAALVLGELSRSARGAAASPPSPRLTGREVQVLRLVAKGLSSRDAARQLGVSHRTVQNHVQNVLGKLQLRNRVELTRYALREGLDDGG